MRIRQLVQGFCALLLVGSAVPVGGAVSEFNDVFNSNSSAGKRLINTLDDLYGMDNLVRISDFGDGNTDQFWEFDLDSSLGKLKGNGKGNPSSNGVGNQVAYVASARAVGKFASYTHEFGLLPGEQGNSFESLFSSGKSRFSTIPGNNMSGTYKSADGAGLFRLGLSVTTKKGFTWSSSVEDNESIQNGVLGDAVDHMITYSLKGTDRYIVAWEDLHAGRLWGGFDGDYTDLIVEISGLKPVDYGVFAASVPVPEPTGVFLFAIGGMVLYVRRVPGRKNTVISKGEEF